MKHRARLHSNAAPSARSGWRVGPRSQIAGAFVALLTLRSCGTFIARAIESYGATSAAAHASEVRAVLDGVRTISPASVPFRHRREPLRESMTIKNTNAVQAPAAPAPRMVARVGLVTNAYRTSSVLC